MVEKLETTEKMKDQYFKMWRASNDATDGVQRKFDTFRDRTTELEQNKNAEITELKETLVNIAKKLFSE